MAPGSCSLEELLAQSSWLRRLATSLVAGDAAADDLVQETWLAALAHPPRPGQPPRPWLARVARNLASNLRRSRVRRTSHERAAPPPVHGCDPVTVAEEVELQRILAEALLRIDEPLRSAVVLRYLRGLGSEEIAAGLGVPAGTVRWRAKRGLELLRADLDRRFGGERARWFQALAALVPPPAAGVGSAGTAVASRVAGDGSHWVASGALGLVAASVLAGWAWLERGDGRRTPRLALTESEILPPPSAPALIAPQQITQPVHAAEGLRTQPARTAQLSTGRPLPPARAPIRGQLMIAGTDQPLDEALTIRVRTGDVSVKETVVSAADGSFRTRTEFPRGYVLAEVLRPAGDAAADPEGFFEPGSSDVWLVPVSWPTFARGRVLDGNGEPLVGATLLLSPAGGEEAEGQRDESTRRDGTFWFNRLQRGTYSLRIQRAFARLDLRFTVGRGPNELGDLVLPVARGHEISGCLRSDVDMPRSSVTLTELSSGVVYEVEASASSGVAPFVFEDVPAGEYLLGVTHGNALRYEPATVRVSPPERGLEFVARSRAEPFLVRAWAGDEELGSVFLVRMHGSWWPGENLYPVDQVERWIVVGEERRPAAGDKPPASSIDVQLEPGWGQVLLFAEAGTNLQAGRGDGSWVGRMLDGVEVRADGERVARSGADGMALVSLARAPDLLEFSLPGWTVQHVGEDTARCVVTMMRE